jgi:UDP-glucuronate 4-epimerase
VMKVLVTGNAGFIGSHAVQRLFARGDAVVGLDSVNDYYDVGLKEARLARLAEAAQRLGADYGFVRANLADRPAVQRLFAEHAFDRVGLPVAGQGAERAVPGSADHRAG